MLKLVVGGIVVLAVALGLASSASASHKRTVFQCEKFAKGSSGRASCFAQLPGANCAHPLEVQKAHETTRGDHRDISVTYSYSRYEAPGLSVGLEETYAWHTTSRNVAICPYPDGVVLRETLLSNEEICGLNAHHQYECNVEYGAKLYHYRSGLHRGEFTHDRKPSTQEKSGYLAIKAYYIHPPWESAQ